MRIRLSLVMFVTALVFSFSVAIIDHFIHQEQAKKHYAEKITFTEETIIESLQTVDKAHSLFGCSTDRKLKDSTDYLMALYESNPNFEDWDFAQLHKELEIDIYIIDEENVIIHTSFEEDLGLDFKECCPTLHNILEERRNIGDLFIDYIDVEQATGKTKKYSYQATKDKKYIIQLSIPLEESLVFEYFSFFPTINQLKEKFTMVEEINVLNIGGLAIGQGEASFKMSPSRYDAFLETRDFFKTTEIKEKYADQELVFRYVYYEPTEETSSQDRRVLEIIYNEDELNKSLSNNTKRLLFQLLVVLVIISISIYGIQKWISRQIYFARHDNLTGLKNRRAFDEIFSKEVKKGKGLTALIIIDLDNFKLVNDRYGHLRGDGLLKLVAKTLTKTVKDPHTVFRLGGDEFAVVLIETNEDYINYIVEELKENIASTIGQEEDLAGLNIQASIGVSIAPLDGIFLETLFQKADLAMYDDKEKGKKQDEKIDSYIDYYD